MRLGYYSLALVAFHSNLALSSPLTSVEKEGLIKVIYSECLQQAPSDVEKSKLAFFCSCYTDEYINKTSHEDLIDMMSAQGEPLKRKPVNLDSKINNALQKCSFHLQ
jgi:hypothetical protein